MELEDLIKTLRKIEIADKNFYLQKLSGSYNSKLNGDGLLLDSIRKYEIGDDIRSINWNVTARFHEPYVNTFIEDKQRLIWLMIDISGSSAFGTASRTKLELEIEAGAILAYNAIKKNDSVGVIFFSDKVEKFIPMSKGMQHFWLMAKTMIDIRPAGNSTNISNALEFMMKINNRRSLVFILSDFISEDYGKLLNVASQKHKMMAVKVYDEKEHNFPGLGWVKLKDSESKKERWVNTYSQKFRQNYGNQFEKADHYFREHFTNHRLNTLQLATHDDVAEKLVNFIIF